MSDDQIEQGLRDEGLTEQDRVDDILVQWELARQDGEDPSPQELCATAPELEQQVAQRVAILKSTSWMTQDITQNDDDVSAVASKAGHEVEQGRGLLEQDTTVSSEQLVQTICEAGIVPQQKLHHVQDTSETDARRLAQSLVDDGLLTHYQAQVLLKQRDSPLLLDRYIILDVIGAGGMGLVFKALHRPMERIVALKVLPNHAVDSPQKVKRFQREIKAAARLSHPNIVTALDADEENGTHFLVMEYVEGDNLFDRVNKLRLNPTGDKTTAFSADEVERIALELAKAMHEVHQRGIIHRDIKPGNVLLTPSGTPKLLDLGLASIRTTTQEHTAPTTVTGIGLAMGTVDYMSPEQALDATQADARSDVYSLGCTLYYLLAEQPPYDHASPVKTIIAHREAIVPDLQKIRSDVSPVFAATVARMMAKDPADRFQTMKEVSDELEGATSAEQSTTSKHVTTQDKGQQDASAKPESSSHRQTLPQTSQPTPHAKLSQRLPLLAIGALAASIAVGWLFWRNSGLVTTSPHNTAIANWVMTEEGVLTVRSNGMEMDVFQQSEIPTTPYQIEQIVVGEPVDNVPLEQLGTIETLRSLHIEACDQRFLNTTRLRNFQQLTSLDLYATDLSDVSIELNSPRLQSLDLSLTGISFERLTGLDRSTKLQELYLASLDVDNSTVKRLLGQHQKLMKLDLSSTQITDDIAPVLAKLDRLAELHMMDTSLSDVGMTELTELRNLEKLYLDHTQVTGKGLRQLASFPKLHHVSLCGLKIGDQSVDHLAAIKTLTVLEIYETAIGDMGLDKLQKLKKLRQLHVHQGQFSDAALDRFYDALPRCDVFEVTDEDEAPEMLGL